MNLEQVKNLLMLAFECSVYLAPLEPGLTQEEVHEIGHRFDLQDGEIDDALRQLVRQYFGARPTKLFPDPNSMMMMYVFPIAKDPDFRNYRALDFVCTQFNDLVRTEGGGNARIPHDVLIERAVAANIPRLDAEAAVAIFTLNQNYLVEKNGYLRVSAGRLYEPLPSVQREQATVRPRSDETRQRIYEAVKDVIARRTDGRRQHAEPLDAFGRALEPLGHGRFHIWWAQAVAELRRTNPVEAPVASLVLAAALVEGALSFVVKHARDRNLGVFGSSDFAGDPRTWKIDKLVNSAARGGATAILDEPTRIRADNLVTARQRIHAGRILSDVPSGPVPDLRPHEARDAKATAERVVQCVLDWLEKYPPT